MNEHQSRYREHVIAAAQERLFGPLTEAERIIPEPQRRYCWAFPELGMGASASPDIHWTHAYVFDIENTAHRCTAARLCKRFGYVMEPARFSRAHVLSIEEIFGTV